MKRIRTHLVRIRFGVSAVASSAPGEARLFLRGDTPREVYRSDMPKVRGTQGEKVEVHAEPASREPNVTMAADVCDRQDAPQVQFRPHPRHRQSTWATVDGCVRLASHGNRRLAVALRVAKVASTKR